MTFRPRPVFFAVAFALALASVGARAGEPTPAMAAAQLGSIPTSPAFSMSVNRNQNGAPEATAIGARPIATHASEPASAAASQPAGAKASAAGKAVATAVGAASAASAASGASNASGSAGTAAPEGDPLEHLRQRLAEKLGAKPSTSNATGAPYVLRVSNRGEPGESVISARSAVAAGGRRAAARAAASAASAASASLPSQWDYTGLGGPQAWGKLKPEYASCAAGARQSPIDIRGGIAVDLEPIQFDYHPSAFSVVDDGHTVRVDVEPGSAITITGRRYELVKFEFHRPSEERVDGRQYDMDVHLVHKDADGKLAVIALLLDHGSAQPVVQTVWNNLPLEKNDAVRVPAKLDIAGLLPRDLRYYTYMGSLTAPPCTEGVLWMVMQQPVQVSPEQVAIFAHLYPMNARPLQQADGRLIKQSE